MKLQIAAALLLTTGLATADPLPRGDTKKIDKGKVKGPTKVVEIQGSCHDDLAYPLVETGYFTSDGKEFFLLATVGKLTQKGKQKNARKLMRYSLHAWDTTTWKMTTKLGLTHRRGGHLITFGEPVLGIQAIVFSGKEATCGLGKATTIGISFAEGAKAVRDTGDFQIVAGRRGRVLVDREKWRLTETDLTTFQTRILANVPKQETPLFYDSQRKYLVTYRKEDKRRGLVNYRVLPSKLEEDQKLAIGPNDRIVRSGSLFGFVTVDAATQTALIRRVPIWTGTKKIVSTKIKAPTGVRFSDALFVANFDANILAITGKTSSISADWGGVFFYDLKDGSKIGKLEAGPRGYFDYVGFDPGGTYLLGEVKVAGETRALKVYDIVKAEMREFDF